MICVRFDPDHLADATQAKWWSDWRNEARDATAAVIEAWEKWVENPASAVKPGDPIPEFKFPFKFKDEIWRELKEWLKKHVFYNKCAYCEAELLTEFGDAEHFRPKGNVIVRDAKSKAASQPKVRLRAGMRSAVEHDLPHPGYFWLAYNWRNLVPACEKCNTGAGKVDQFPAGCHEVMVPLSPAERAQLKGDAIESPKWKGYFYLSPEDMDAREKPLLLNPLNAEGEWAPTEHICFGIKGIVAAVEESPVGTETIRIFQLEREELRKARQRQQEAIHKKYLDEFVKYGDPVVNRQNALAAIEDFRKGAEPFSAAAMSYLEDLLEKIGQPLK